MALDNATRASVMQQARDRAAANGTTPELELWKYATSPEIGYSPDQIDEAMGWPTGTSQNWAVANGVIAAPQGNYTPTNAAPASPATPPQPPTWQDSFNAFNQSHVDQYGIGIDRPWNSDADAARAKQGIDDNYVKALQDYNAKYGTNIQPDASVLGANTQPSTYTPKPEGGWFTNNIVKPITGDFGNIVAKAGAFLTGANAAGGLLTPAAETAALPVGQVSAAVNPAAVATAATTPAIDVAAGVPTFGSEANIANAVGSQAAPLSGGLTAAEIAGGSTGGGLLSNAVDRFTNAASSVSPSQWLTTGMNLAGGFLNQQAAADAAKTQADAQIRAAQIAADAAKFRPVGVKTNFGQSNFGYDANGNLTSAGYTLDPQMQWQQNLLKAAAPGMLDQFTQSKQYLQPMVDAAGRAADIGRTQTNLGEGMLYNAQQWNPNVAALKAQTAPMGTAASNAMALGNQYLQTSPQQQAAKYMADQQALLAPGRAQELAALQAQMQAQGRGGLMVGGGVNGQMASNPQMQALYNARMQQDAQLAAQATQGGMDYAKFGIDTTNAGGNMLQNMYSAQAAAYDPYSKVQNLGQNQVNYGLGATGAGAGMLRDMFSTQTAAYAPYQQAMQGAQYLEGLGQNAMDLGIGLGSKETASRAAAGGMLAGGMTNAANTVGTQAQAAGSMWGNLMQGGANAFENYNKPAGTTYDPTKYRVVPL